MGGKGGGNAFAGGWFEGEWAFGEVTMIMLQTLIGLWFLVSAILVFRFHWVARKLLEEQGVEIRFFLLGVPGVLVRSYLDWCSRNGVKADIRVSGWFLAELSFVVSGAAMVLILAGIPGGGSVRGR